MTIAPSSTRPRVVASITTMPSDMDPSITNPLEQLTIDQLRARTSMKWTTFPAGVLPLWVAEMDVPLAEPVAARLHEAIDAGDTGYPSGRAYARALQSFAADRWGWGASRPSGPRSSPT